MTPRSGVRNWLCADSWCAVLLLLVSSPATAEMPVGPRRTEGVEVLPSSSPVGGGESGSSGLAESAIPPELTLPQTFVGVWYRQERKPPLKAFAASGRLTITAGELEFSSRKVSLIIPLSQIADVTLRTMKGDPANNWAVVTYKDEGKEEAIGLRDGRGLEWGGETKPIRDSIQTAMSTAVPPACAP